MATELEELRARSRLLADRLGDQDAVDVNAAILDIDPGDPVATNRLGIGLLKQGLAADAVVVLEAGLRVHPDDSIMQNRLAEARRALEKPPLTKKKGASRLGHSDHVGATTGWTDFEPAELVEQALAGPGRDACVRFFAASIRAAESLDQSRTAVTPIKHGRRFRAIGGIMTGVAPWKESLSVAVPASSRSVIGAVEDAGGEMLGCAIAVPCVELLIPRARVEGLSDMLLAAHKEHLRLSIEAGPPTPLNKHHPGLRRYLLEQADHA